MLCDSFLGSVDTFVHHLTSSPLERFMTTFYHVEVFLLGELSIGRQ